VNLGIFAGVAHNRSGEPDAVVLLDERELTLAYRPREDSGITLRWNYQDIDWATVRAKERRSPFADQQTIEELGFDCSIRPGDSRAPAFYGRMLPRRALVVFAVGGPDWDERLREWQRRALDDLPHLLALGGRGADPVRVRESIEQGPYRASRLAPVDIGTDAGEMRARYPDRTSFFQLPVLVRVGIRQDGTTAGGPVLSAYLVQLFPEAILVPRRVRSALARLTPSQVGPVLLSDARVHRDLSMLATPPRYAVRIAIGRALQPWIVDVALASPSTQSGVSRRPSSSPHGPFARLLRD
jgi:hypothetical protein